MPKHNSAQKPQKKKPSTGGGVATRSQVTGRQLGRAAIRALEKNAHCIDEFLSKIDDAENMDDLLNIEEVDAFYVARVIRSEGAGWFNVLLRDGSEAKVHVAGTIAFHGRAGTKTDRDNCIIANDNIIISGGRASAKLSSALSSHIKKVFKAHSFPYPKNFFGNEESVAEDDAGWEFDHSEDEEAEVADMKKTIASRSKNNGAAAAADDDESDDDDFIDVDAI